MLNISDTQKKIGLLVGVVLVFVVLGTGVMVFPSASNGGYQPDQPIPYSHKLHAGQLKIQCQYCHVGAEKSQHATIPSLGVCMNCHKVVRTESPWIQKMTAAYNEGKPIEWVRIHELPDHVYFPHHRHVNRGIACETCHGDIKTMEKVYQHAALDMGWCMDCHRGVTTPKNIVKQIQEEQGSEKRFIRDGQIAPTDCSTCHK